MESPSSLNCTCQVTLTFFYSLALCTYRQFSHTSGRIIPGTYSNPRASSSHKYFVFRLFWPPNSPYLGLEIELTILENSSGTSSGPRPGTLESNHL